ncbi:MAG: AEC family transporter [Parvularculaceae bacterium]|nr:AEC family transporter [Parvularculaceae bacterium]
MNAATTVAFPVFAVIAAGYFAGRFRFASAEDSAALNRFVFRFGFPAALFALMSGAKGLTALDARIAFSYGAPALIVMALAYLIGRRAFALDPQTAGAHAFASVIGNAVFLGLPIALGVEGWARPFVTLMLVEGILIIGVGAALMAPRDENQGAGLAARTIAFVKRPLTNPLVAAALAGFAFALLGFDLAAPVRTFFELLGRAAGPVALFSLGLFFATHPAPPVGETLGKTFAIFALKMALLPVLCFTLAAALHVDQSVYKGALALFTVTPTAVGAYVMASQYGRYVEETAAAIACTTALSIFSITAVLVFFAV